jgi:hypothetical protein
MGGVVDVTAILASLSAFGTAVAAGTCWIYKRGQESGRMQARLERLEEDRKKQLPP